MSTNSYNIYKINYCGRNGASSPNTQKTGTGESLEPRSLVQQHGEPHFLQSNTAVRRQEGQNFKASLSYTVRLRPTWAIWSESASKGKPSFSDKTKS